MAEERKLESRQRDREEEAEDRRAKIDQTSGDHVLGSKESEGGDRRE